MANRWHSVLLHEPKVYGHPFHPCFETYLFIFIQNIYRFNASPVLSDSLMFRWARHG